MAGRDGFYEVIPVEYKRGKPKETDIDALQLTAQAICLEEMLCCEIPCGYLYYGEIKHREKIEFSSLLREKVSASFQEMHRYFEQRYTPKVKWSKSCNACSLKDICMPVLNKNLSVFRYIDQKIKEKDGD